MCDCESVVLVVRNNSPYLSLGFEEDQIKIRSMDKTNRVRAAIDFLVDMRLFLEKNFFFLNVLQEARFTKEQQICIAAALEERVNVKLKQGLG